MDQLKNWLPTFLSLLSLVGLGVSWGRWTQKAANAHEDLQKDINGLGNRVTTVEGDVKEIGTKLESNSEQIQRMLGQHDNLLHLLGEARGNSIQCREDTLSLGEKLETKLENIRSQINDARLELSQRLTGVEKELSLTREKRS